MKVELFIFFRRFRGLNFEAQEVKLRYGLGRSCVCWIYVDFLLLLGLKGMFLLPLHSLVIHDIGVSTRDQDKVSQAT